MRNITAVKPATLLQIIRIQTEIAKIGLDLDAVMSVVVDEVHSLTGASGAVIELVDGDDMVYRAASGAVERRLGLRLSRVGSLSGLCVEEGRTLVCEDAERDPRVDLEACRSVGLRSMVVAPLRYLGEAVGVLKVISPDIAAFSEEDVEVVVLMSEMVAAAMFHAISHEASPLYIRATRDPLTGLANRALFYDRLRQAFAQAARAGEHLALLNLDMDGLKLVNDRRGHRAGDAALAELARRIVMVTRDSDTAARVGGDEFAVLLMRVRDRAAVQKHSRRLAAQIARPFRFEGKPVNLSASIGIALYPDDASEFEALVEAADQAMYAVKRLRERAAG